MTNEQIIEMAYQAKPVGGLEFDEAGIVRFFHLVAAHQREMDAKVCDERAARALKEPWSGMDACWSGANDCAAAIRGRKE